MLRVITTYNDFLSLESDWNRLLALRPDHSVFDTFEWNRLWLKHFQHQNEICILVLYGNHNDQRSGGNNLFPERSGAESKDFNNERFKFHASSSTIFNILPLVKAGHKYYLIGGLDRDRSLFFVPPSKEDFGVLFSYLNGSSRHSSNSNNYYSSSGVSHRAGQSREVSLYTHGELRNLPIQEAWNIKWVLEELKIPHRLTLKKEYCIKPERFELSSRPVGHEMQRKHRRLSSLGTLKYEPVPAERFNEYLEFLFTHNEARALDKNYQQRFSDSAYRDWFTEMLNSQKLKTLPFALTLDNKILVVDVGFLYQGILSNYSTAFDPSWYRHSPGMLRIPLQVEYCQNQNIIKSCLGSGEMGYKQQFTDDYTQLAHVIMFKNSVIKFLFEMRNRLRSIKNIIQNTQPSSRAITRDPETKNKQKKNSFLFSVFFWIPAAVYPVRSLPRTLIRRYGAGMTKKTLKYLFLIPLYLAGLHHVFERTNNKRIRILCYHKVSDSDSHPITVSVSQFLKQVHHLKTHFTIMRLSEIKEYLIMGKSLPKNHIAITFDDGYRDNYEIVFPIIKRLNIPISIFLCGAYVQNTNHMIHNTYHITNKQNVIASETKQSSAVTPGFSPESKQQTKKQKDSTHNTRYEIRDTKYEFYPWDSEKERCLSEDEISEMLSSGLVEFYPHTMTHPLLTKIPLDEAKKEIEESKQWIESLIHQCINDQCSNNSTQKLMHSYIATSGHYIPDIFSYPFGGYNDFTKDHERIVKEAGFSMAVSVKQYSHQNNINMFDIERRVALNEPLWMFKLRSAGVIDWIREVLDKA